MSKLISFGKQSVLKLYWCILALFNHNAEKVIEPDMVYVQTSLILFAFRWKTPND
ncbi:hypothetical protein [Catenovulum maritimum]|uniref:hypothetical protein n=1 Tax=Catenovulum maritimum TaxID=1513271 RepID=UPI0012B64ED6|nr:hypothetical protein [Catenovulum maritimum]